MKETHQKESNNIREIAQTYGLEYEALKQFVDTTIDRLILDATKLTDLFEPLDLNWKERSKKEVELMKELIPLLKETAEEREISGLKIYEKYI